MRINRSKIVPFAAIGLMAAAGSAFTASNSTTPLTSAGFGATTADGFKVSDVQYQLGANAVAGDVDKGDDLDAVQFTLDPKLDTNLPASQVRVRLVKTGLYYDCDVVGTPAATAGTPTTWNCNTTLPASLQVASVDALDIVAVSQADIA